MKIYYSSMGEDQLAVSTSFEFAEDGEKISVTDFAGELTKAGNAYFLRGFLQFNLECVCDRCAEVTVMKFTHNIASVIEPARAVKAEPLLEYEITDDDGDIYVTDPEFLDLHDILRQEALLMLPIKRLCSENCKGLLDEESEEECDSNLHTPLSNLANLKGTGKKEK